MAKVFALTTAQGTACPETALTEIEFTPERCRSVEQQFCGTREDDPVPGTWVDVTGNEAVADYMAA